MKKLILFIIPLLIAIAIFFVFTFFTGKNTSKGALQITANPKSTVYLNGKIIGQTPLCKCETKDMLLTGDYTIRLVPTEGSFTPFEEKVPINKSVLTVVDRTFNPGTSSDGSIITLNPLESKKGIELLVISFPDRANVFLDNTASGQTPLLLKDITESDHEIRLAKDGYKDKIVRIRAVNGYKLTSTVYLGINPSLPTLSPSPVASPTASVKVPMVVILETPTGFLNVRSDAAVSSTLITTVTPGEKYELQEEKTDWFKIKLKDGKVGWISSQYARKEN